MLALWPSRAAGATTSPTPTATSRRPRRSSQRRPEARCCGSRPSRGSRSRPVRRSVSSTRRISRSTARSYARSGRRSGRGSPKRSDRSACSRCSERSPAARTPARGASSREQAATAQQLDQAERDYRVLGEQIAALRAQRNSVTQDVAASDARVAQIAERIAKSRITAPFAGTVLATYARAGEYVQPGQPLFRLASLDTLTLRAYVTEPQLAQVKLGQRVQVTVDRGAGDRLTMPGTVSWIASKAEFTPTPMQTRDERADLVYAVKIRVPNRGRRAEDRHARRRRARRQRPARDARRSRRLGLGARQALRRRRRARRRLVRRSSRRAVRLHRTGRRRQDDAVPHAHHAAAAGRGHRAAFSGSTS